MTSAIAPAAPERNTTKSRRASAARILARILAGSLAGSLCALVLNGCTTVGPNFTRPAPVSQARGYLPASEIAPGSVTATSEALAQDWWTLLPSPALDQVIRMTLASNLDLDAANASLDSAGAELAAARGAQLPDLTASSSAARERLNLASFGFGGTASAFPNNPEFSLYSVGGMASFPLDENTTP